MDSDVLVVGSGFAGLVSGAILAKHGFKVTVLEKHDRPGGFASHFRRKGFQFEVAVHSIEGHSQQNIRSRIFDFLEIDKKVEFLKMENLYRLHGVKGQLNIPCSIEGAKSTLKEYYPCQAQGIETFFEKLLSVSEEFYQFQTQSDVIDFSNPLFSVYFPNLFELLNISLTQFITSIVSHQELQWLLISNIGFYHNDPSRYPAAYFLINQSHYLKGGAVYTKGGTQNLSNALVEIIEEQGGQVLLRREVSRIEESKNGVTACFHPTRSIGETQSLSAKYLVINASPPYALKTFFEQKDQHQFEGLRPSTSASTLYLGLDKAFHQLYPVDFFNFFTEVGVSSGAKTANLDFSLVDSSLIDLSLQERQRFTVDMVFLDSYQRWKKAFEQDQYDELKHQTTESLIDRLKTIAPSIEEHIKVFELGTPLTIERFTHNFNGAAYGFDITSANLSQALSALSMKHQPFKTDSQRILFASAWSSLSHGLTGASLAGYQAAQSILDKEQNTKDNFL